PNCLVTARTSSTLICSGVREAGVDRGWPETDARRSFVAGSARPAWTVGGLRQTRVASVDVGGPDMAPHTPPRSQRPGKPVALLDHPRVASVDVGGPDMAPHTPPRSQRPGKPAALLDHPRVAHRKTRARRR